MKNPSKPLSNTTYHQTHLQIHQNSINRSDSHHSPISNNQIIQAGIAKLHCSNRHSKQVSLFRSCTLCVQGSAQKQDVAEPPKPHP